MKTFTQFLESAAVMLGVSKGAESAQTSTYNDDPTTRDLTDDQKISGEYQKGLVEIHGLQIMIENPRYSVRKGINNEWSNTQHDHYGYIVGTLGADDDELDIYIGPQPQISTFFVFNCTDPETGLFDEHKIVFGYETDDEAMHALLKNYDENYWDVLPTYRRMSQEEFRHWTVAGDTQNEV